MKATIEEQDNLKRRIAIEVPNEDVREVYHAIYAQMRISMRINGFRKGKYPQHLFEKRFREVMEGEAMQKLVPRYYQQALEQLDMTPATEPSIDKLEIDKKKPFKFEVTFEVAPEFDLPTGADFSLDNPPIKVSAKDIEARIDEMRMARAALEEKKGKAEDGDVVTFDFKGYIDRVAFDGGTAENQRIEIGAGQYLPDFEENIRGMKAGESKSFPITFPDDYPGKEVAGKEADFDVTVHKVEKKVPAVLDDAFYGQFGEEVKDAATFNDYIKGQLEREEEGKRRGTHHEALMEQLRAWAKFDVPESLVAKELDEFVHRLSHDEPDVLANEKEFEKRRKEEESNARGNIRAVFALNRLAREYGIEVDKNQIEQQFAMQCYMMGQRPDQVLKSELGERLLMSLERNAVMSGTLDRLTEEVLAGGGKKSAAKKDGATEKAAKEDKPKAAPKKAAAAKEGTTKAAKEKAPGDKAKKPAAKK